MGLGFWLLVVVIALLLYVLPSWRHSSEWGWMPSISMLVLLLLVILLILFEITPLHWRI